jgi:hypothetical protein
MFSAVKVIVAGLALGAAVFAAGCQSGGKPSPNAMMGTASSEGIACDKCNVTFVKSPTTNDKGRIIGYTTRKQMVCPDCKSAAANLFATGKMEHTCTSCGGNMSGCAVH